MSAPACVSHRVTSLRTGPRVATSRGGTHQRIHPMSVGLRRIRRYALLLAGVGLLAGCSRSLLTAPAPTRASEPVLESGTAPAPPAPAARARRPRSLAGEWRTLPAADTRVNWLPVVSALVMKGEECQVVGHRWALQFEKGSLSDDETITIKDYDPNVL